MQQRPKVKRSTIEKHTALFPVRLPHDLRRELDRAVEITGQSRAQIMFNATRLYLKDLLNNYTTVKATENKTKE